MFDALMELCVGKIKTALGLMSGTSMDGIDLALVETDGRDHVVCGATGFAPYDAAFAQTIAAGLKSAKAMKSRSERPDGLATLETDLTERHAEAVARFLADNDLTTDQIDVIGFHGQTVLHRPDHGLTVQLGDGAALADLTGIDVVWDMRANDMENGGQGAPLVPAFHRALARSLSGDGPIAFVNIGGIANVTFVPTDDAPRALDCGPGNALIDQWVRKHTNRDFDMDGDMGLSGSVDRQTVEAYLADPFFAQTGPKSLDRDDFTLEPMPDMAPADGAATLAELTAIAIARSAVEVSPSKWVVSGGGAHNRAIVARLKAHLGEGAVITAHAAGFSSDAMEAQAWAYLAVRSLRGLALTWPSTTGCEEPVTGGVLSRSNRRVSAP